MSELSVSGIAGTDGQVPVYEKNARWTTWNLKELWLGQAGAGKYVGKVDDHAVNTDTGETLQIVSVDPTTLIPTFKPVKPIFTGEFDDNDILLGVGPGTQSDTYRVYIDKTVMPHTLAVDARLFVGGSMVTTCKLFRGSELKGTAEVISAFYDQSGQLLGQAIPLEYVGERMGFEGNDAAVKSVPVCHTSFDLPDGEVITAVFFHAAGHVASKRQLLVENTAFIRSTDQSTKYVTGITMESPFMSAGDPKLLLFPMNVPLSGLNLMGVVHYSDGTTLRMPVDGTKFSVFGFEGYVATIPGQKFGLVLKYNLSSDEVAYGPGAGGRFITDSYRAVTKQVEGQYTVKVFGFPVWVDAQRGYRMEWFMYNLDRTAVYRVTPYVKFNDNTRVFDPTAYGVHQRLSISLNLTDVNGTFASYIHVQTIDIVLMGQGTVRTTNWTVAFDPGQNPPFGENNFASTFFINANMSKLKVDSGAATQAEWLDRLYYRTKPLINDDREVAAPAPNFFKILIGTDEIEFPISQWNTEQVINSVLANSSTVFIKFIKRTADNDIQLAVCGLPVYQTN